MTNTNKCDKSLHNKFNIFVISVYQVVIKRHVTKSANDFCHVSNERVLVISNFYFQ